MTEPLTDSQLWVMRQGCSHEMGTALDEIERLRAEITRLNFTINQWVQCGDDIMAEIGKPGPLSDSDVIGEIERLKAEVNEVRVEAAELRKEAATAFLAGRGSQHATIAKQATEIERLKDGIRYWSYCMSRGMREECPEKVEELMDFLISCKIAPYYQPIQE